MYILYKYLLKETVVPFFLSLFVFTGVLFLFRILKLVELVVNKNVSLVEITLLFSYVIPRFLEIALPMSLLIGVLIAFGRLSGDSEIIVMRAVGISLKQLVVPVLIFSIFATILTLITSFWIRPWANYQLGIGLFNIAKTQARSGIVPGVFNDFGSLMVYSERSSEQGARLEDVVISDARDKDRTRTSFAKFGQLVSDDKSRSLTLRLYDGSIFEGSSSEYNVTRFDIKNVSLDTAELLDGEKPTRGKKTSEMTMGELHKELKQHQRDKNSLGTEQIKFLTRLEIEWHKRFVLPFSCIAVALIAMCLGIQPSRGGYSWGMSANIVIGVIVIVLYYLLFALATALAKQAIAPASIVLWIPNIIYIVMALYLLKQISSEKWLAVSQTLGEFVEKLAKWGKLT